MIFRSNDEIYSLVKAFEERTLPRDGWTHQTHLAIATFYCNILPFGMATNVMRDGIHWLNDIHGIQNDAGGGYHETLTVFWLKRIWNFIDSRVGHTELFSLVNEVIERFGNEDLPFKYYTRELLCSEEARRNYYPPDLRLRPAFSYAISLAILKPLVP